MSDSRLKLVLAKTAFVGTVVVGSLILAAPVLMAFHWLIPTRRGPDGLYPPGPGVGPGLIIGTASLWVANWLISILFHAVGIAPERWSLFRRSGGP